MHTHGVASLLTEWHAAAKDRWMPYVESGGVHAPGAGMVCAPFATCAYVPGGGYVEQEPAAIDYAARGLSPTGTAWVALHASRSAAVGGWSRQPGTHYLVAAQAGEPEVPADGLLLLQVKTTGGALAQVRRLGTPTPEGRRVINAVCDFGVEPLADIQDVTTWRDQSGALQAALDAAATYSDQSAATRATVYLPTGQYYLAHQVAIPGGVWLRGDGKFATVVCTNTAFAADGLLLLAPPGHTPGGVTGMAVSCFGGAAAGSLGINVQANGAWVRDVWVSGFATGILLASTSQFLDDFYVELNTFAGVRITSPHVQVAFGQLYGNALGLQVDNAAYGPGDQGPVVLTNVSDLQSTVAGFDILGHNVTLSAVSCWADNPTRYSQGGVVLTGAVNCRIVGYDGRMEPTGGGFASTGVGILVRAASTQIQIGSASMAGWVYGLQVDNASYVQVQGALAQRNKTHGVTVTGGSYIVLAGNTARDNGFGAFDGVGFSVGNTASFARMQLTGNLSIGEGIQRIGYQLYNEGTDAELLFVGNTAVGNLVSQVTDLTVTQAGKNGIRNLGVESFFYKSVGAIATLSFGTIGAHSAVDRTLAVPGASIANVDAVALGIAPTSAVAGILYTAYVSAADTVTVRAANLTAAPLGVSDGVYTVQVWKTTRN